LKKSKVIIDKVDYPYIYGHHKNIEKILYYIDWPKNKHIRDRIYRNFDRRTRCLEPDRFIGIDYNGNVVPCCEIRSENLDNSLYIFGNINKESILDIFNKGEYKKFREILKKGEYNIYPGVCRNCDRNGGRYTGNKPGIEYL
jgi:radical SAM protein with 4Fe4S-binding SPASM domain